MAQCEIELRAPKSSVPKHLPVSQQKPSLSRHHQSSISDHNPKSWPKPGLFIRDGSPKMPPQPQPLVSFCSHLTAKAKNLMKELNGGGVRRHVLWGDHRLTLGPLLHFCIALLCTVSRKPIGLPTYPNVPDVTYIFFRRITSVH